jgi:hypothetical protein
LTSEYNFCCGNFDDVFLDSFFRNQLKNVKKKEFTISEDAVIQTTLVKRDPWWACHLGPW